jgi:thiosulfate/3-mercaptopyruvate sulfurtransferase
MSVAPLVDSTWLKANLGNPNVVVVDTRWYLLNPTQGHTEYLASHIAGAIYLSIDHDLSAEAWDGPGRHPLPKPERFVATMSQAGIDNTCHVVIYDSAGGSTATGNRTLAAYGVATILCVGADVFVITGTGRT